MYDNVTEHLRTVNIIERFNIHQEIILGTLYRVLPMQVITFSVRVYLHIYVFVSASRGARVFLY